jgi:hypothetical protein
MVLMVAFVAISVVALRDRLGLTRRNPTGRYGRVSHRLFLRCQAFRILRSQRALLHDMGICIRWLIDIMIRSSSTGQRYRGKRDFAATRMVCLAGLPG